MCVEIKVQLVCLLVMFVISPPPKKNPVLTQHQYPLANMDNLNVMRGRVKVALLVDLPLKVLDLVGQIE